MSNNAEASTSDAPSPGSVTAQIPGLKAGDPQAEAWILNRYFQQVARAARIQLGASPRTAHDEEDVALSVFGQFLTRVKNNGFRQLNDRSDLHSILLMLTRRRAIDYFRRAMARRQHEVGESALSVDSARDGSDSRVSLAEVAAVQPSQELVDEIAEEIRSLFAGISGTSTPGRIDLHLDRIALMRLDGYTVAEIASELQCDPGTVYRRLDLIRRRWTQHCLDCE